MAIENVGGSIIARAGWILASLLRIPATVITTSAGVEINPGAPVLAAGENFAGTVGGVLRTVSVTPTVEATPDYSDGDVIGGIQTVAAIVRADTKTAYMAHIQVVSSAAIAVSIDAFVFSASPSASTTTENGAFALHANDRDKLLGVARIDTWRAGGTPVAGSVDCRIPLTGLAADDVWVVMVARGTINLASTSDLICHYTADCN